MPAKFVRLESIEALDAIFERSYRQPVAIFKHSNSCGLSADILQQIEAINGDVNIVVVQENRNVSDAIEKKTGFRHQSPQAFVIKGGKIVYHASHYGIDAEQLSVVSGQLSVEED